MVDPISNTPNPRDAGSSPSRPQASPSVPGAMHPATNLSPDQRVEVLQETVEKLIKKSLPNNSKLQIEQDKATGTFIYRSIDRDTGQVIRQWPAEQLLKLHEYLKEMEGMLIDKQV